MTTENQNIISPKSTTTNSSEVQCTQKMSPRIEERKGNVIKPLSLRPNRSVKKNTSLKPLGLRSR